MSSHRLKDISEPWNEEDSQIAQLVGVGTGLCAGCCAVGAGCASCTGGSVACGAITGAACGTLTGGVLVAAMAAAAVGALSFMVMSLGSGVRTSKTSDNQTDSQAK